MNAHPGCWNSEKRFASRVNTVLTVLVRVDPNSHYPALTFQTEDIPHSMSTDCRYSRDNPDDHRCSGCRHHSNPTLSKETFNDQHQRFPQ